MTDHAAAAQKAAEERLDACWEAFDAECEGDDAEAMWPEDMAGPFDGCRTCEIREVLDAAMPHLLELAREELRDWRRMTPEEFGLASAPAARETPEMGTPVDTMPLFELDEESS